MDVRKVELYALLEEAERQVQANPEAEQVIVVKTAKANMYHFANYDITSGSRADEDRFVELLREQDDTEVQYLVAMWNNGGVDLPSHHFRSRLLEPSPKNGEAVMPLQGEEGYMMENIGVTMS